MSLPPEPGSRHFLRPFAGEAVSPPPIWLMRQAGRYLPEYRAVRTKAGGFLDLCYAPALAAEVTLQPIRRFGFDAAILFSDILVVPDALGQKVAFVEGEGPRLDPVRSAPDLRRLSRDATRPKFALVSETVARLRQDLPRETALIGFCGAPWTVASYMVEGQGSPDQREARLWAYRDPVGFGRLIDLLVEASIEYLSGQVQAGADVLQIFDTWAGALPLREFEAWVVAADPADGERGSRQASGGAGHRLSAGGGGARSNGTWRRRACKAWGPTRAWKRSRCGSSPNRRARVVQGNLDPLALVAGGEAIERQTVGLLKELAGVPYIFNLGHGIVPETPPEHVGRLVELVRGGGIR